MLAQVGGQPTDHNVEQAVEFLRRSQQADGSWYGRWGMNYIYGTWSSLCALAAVGMDGNASEVRRAVGFLASIQNADGGWGEDGESYKLDYQGYEPADSTASQTAWALLGLLAAGEIDNPAVKRGISYLIRNQKPDGAWSEPQFTATGFPRVFYLRYDGYSKYFPLWALARYRNLRSGNAGPSRFGM
jgi:squalene-hopene/tetraprenyl-beta-curcumene cyclase